MIYFLQKNKVFKFMKKEYTKPKMEKLGNMVQITLGGGSGTNDPGGPETRKP